MSGSIPATHPADSVLYHDRFTTPELQVVFSDAGRIGAWLRFEVALTESQVELGLLPRGAADAIALAASSSRVTPERVAEAYRHTQLDTAAFVQVLAECVPRQVAGYVHWGATSTDVLDTGLALQLAAAWEVMVNDLVGLRAALAAQANVHRSTLMVARTHSQHALPITFGFKLAMWVDELTNHFTRLNQLRPRLLVGKVTGAAGSQAAFGPLGLELQRLVCRRLGLETPTLEIQLSRARLQEFLAVLALVGNTLDQIAHDIWTRQRTEFAELEEPFDSGVQKGSTTLPFKHNPFVSEWIRGQALLLRRNAAAMFSVVPEDERDGVRNPVEYVVVPESCLLLGAMLRAARHLVQRLVVHPERMRENLERGGAAAGEAVMMALARGGLGKQQAYAIVYACAENARTSGVPLAEVLRDSHEVRQTLSEYDLETALDVTQYLGTIPQQIDAALARQHVEIADP